MWQRQEVQDVLPEPRVPRAAAPGPAVRSALNTLAPPQLRRPVLPRDAYSTSMLCGSEANVNNKGELCSFDAINCQNLDGWHACCLFIVKDGARRLTVEKRT